MADLQPAPAIHQSPIAAEAGVQEGDTVVLDINGEKQAFVTVKRAG